MANRKQTPDVLGAVLGDPAPAAEAPAPSKTVHPPPTSPRNQGEASSDEVVPSPLPSVDGGIEGGRSSQRKNDAKSLPPRQWQYVVITFYDYGGWKPRFRDGREIAGWKGLPDMPDYINLIGEDGWELAGTSNGRRREIMAYFKRPKKVS